MEKTVHHLIPRSRCDELGIKQKSDKRNLKKINGKLHIAWHTLFTNRTPYEVVYFLYMLRALNLDGIYIATNIETWKVLFGYKSVLEACAIIAKEWTPPRSFYEPHVLMVNHEKFFSFFNECFASKEKK
ncbi:MAG: hypothetical protein KGI50_04710 [Patescibacteria group bacterium]|nr:hypothetical protein [Patescibacteria group bacterium]MDE2438661.1 hypothetical protein [Patescibacteria group bacterium]